MTGSLLSSVSLTGEKNRLTGNSRTQRTLINLSFGDRNTVFLHTINLNFSNIKDEHTRAYKLHFNKVLLEYNFT
jgi:hypothetical protein